MKKKLIENNNFNKLYHSNITIIILFVALIFSFIKVSKEIVLRYNINKEINIIKNSFRFIANDRRVAENTLENKKYYQELCT